MGNLTSLTEVYLHYNELSGNIPPSLAHLPSLSILYLAFNNLSGGIPPTMGSLTSLTELYLDNNELSGSIPPSLANLTSLSVLEMSCNNLSGGIPPAMENLTSLTELYLYRNELSGDIPPTIGNLFSLTVLMLYCNRLSGSIPTSIGMLQNLHKLDMYYNKLSWEIPTTIGNLTQLIYLYLDYNDLSGDIPASLGNCQKLEVLNLASNKLTGAIPKDVLTIYTLSIGLFLASNSLTGLVPAEINNLRNLGIIDLSMNNLSGEIPNSLGECEVLEELYLGGNFFQGSIPTSFRSLRGMGRLDVSKNKLSGKIPDFLQDFRDLYYLNLSFNNFEGEVPRLGIFQNASAVSVVGNNKLCGRNPGLHLPACFSQSPNKKHKSHTLVLIFGITGSFLFLIIFFSIFIGQRRKKSSCRKPHESMPIGEQHEKISYAELVKATNGFSADNIIGMGSFGTVYKGMLDGDSRKVVVKVLNLQTKGASKSFLAECEAMRNIRHRNLVKILTACSSVDFRGNDFKALVSEFMDNGSLDNWLHPKASEQSKPKLNLKQRLDIAIDVASALDYLHHQGDTPIIHCDLKPSNILLDGDMTAHVGDFGLARFLKKFISKSFQHSTSSAGLKGTVGYIAPEYGMANKVSTLGDVYSFGILLLEMFTAKSPTEDMFTAGLSLRKFVMMAFPERIMDAVDTYLLSEEDAGDMTGARAMDCIASMLGIGISCSNDLPAERMEMGIVVRELHKVRDVFIKNESREVVRGR